MTIASGRPAPVAQQGPAFSCDEFPATAPAANPVFYRTYSRRTGGRRETWADVTERNIAGLAELGKLNSAEEELLRRMQLEQQALPSGRWLWIGGTPWSRKPANFFGSYNCTSTNLVDWEAFGLMMDLAMMGCGTGAIIEPRMISQLPRIRNTLEIAEVSAIGTAPAGERQESTTFETEGQRVSIVVGDSRQGWVAAYQLLFELASAECFDSGMPILASIDLSNVRPPGEKIEGFGGIANPVKLEGLYKRIAQLLSRAQGRQLTSVECCLLIDEAALTIVAGNVRRSAGMRQFWSGDREAAAAKDSLWQQDDEGNWSIDPERDALRMANHTRVFHTRPGWETVLEAVTKQFYSGEGAIQFAPEAIARSNADLLTTPELRRQFVELYCEQGQDAAGQWLRRHHPGIEAKELDHRLGRYGLNPCGEITGSDFFCNLTEIHLNRIHPTDFRAQEDAFRAGAIAAAALLNHKFVVDRYRYSRELDPIVGVSFTGLFDFFVHAFGTPWLKWWEAGRPNTDEGRAFKAREADYLQRWRQIVDGTVWEYCDRHGLRRPNRCTTVQPAGCLDKDALRVFDQGLLFADELVAPGSGETESLPLSVRGGIGTTTAIANQPLDLMKITFKNGRTLRMTPDHRLSVAGAWVRADAMQLGMEVDYSLGQYTRAEECPLLPISGEAYTRGARAAEAGHGRGVLARTITTPSAMSPELGYFLGALFGNGCVSPTKHRIRFTHGDSAVLQRFADAGERLFGIPATEYQGEDKAAEVSFSSKQLFDWLHLNGLAKAEKSANLLRIPERVRRSSRQAILAFFAGLIDTDGCPRSSSLSIDTASEPFMRHLQQVGEAVGLCFGLSHNTEGENMQSAKSIWSLHLSRTRSNWEAVSELNQFSYKLQSRPVEPPKADRGYSPYSIAAVTTEYGQPDYSYDFAVEGVDDDDSWYWQGALKSHNTKSLLTGASPGWHPPKAQRFIRRITFRKGDPVALACMDYGYAIVPSQSSRDEQGNLLSDPFDPRCEEWLVEIPTEVSWANLPGADEIDINAFSALAQFDFYMQVQTHYTAHNTSATIEFREPEIEALAHRIHDAIQEGEGYISAALLARFDANETFPRLPFEPINQGMYQRLCLEVSKRRKVEDFFAALAKYDHDGQVEAGPAGCDSDKCLFPLATPEDSE